MSEGSLLLGQMPGCLPELLALGIPGFPFLMGLPGGGLAHPKEDTTGKSAVTVWEATCAEESCFPVPETLSKSVLSVEYLFVWLTSPGE